MGYVYYKYDDFILLSTDHFGNLTLLLLYLATWPKALIVGFLIFAVTAPSTIAIFRYKRPVDKWQKNWIFLTWDSIALIIWIIILFAVQQFSFSVMG